MSMQQNPDGRAKSACGEYRDLLDGLDREVFDLIVPRGTIALQALKSYILGIAILIRFLCFMNLLLDLTCLQ